MLKLILIPSFLLGHFFVFGSVLWDEDLLDPIFNYDGNSNNEFQQIPEIFSESIFDISSLFESPSKRRRLDDDNNNNNNNNESLIFGADIYKNNWKFEGNIDFSDADFSDLQNALTENNWNDSDILLSNNRADCENISINLPESGSVSAPVSVSSPIPVSIAPAPIPVFELESASAAEAAEAEEEEEKEEEKDNNSDQGSVTLDLKRLNLVKKLSQMCTSQIHKKKDFCACTIKNWPEDVDLKSRIWTEDEISKIESRMNEFVFQFKTVRLRNNIISVKSSKDKIYAKNRDIKEQLKTIFKSQHPGEKFSLRDYKIIGWPNDIDMNTYSWTLSEIDEIQSKISGFVFEKRPISFSQKIQLGIDKLNLEGILNQSWQKDVVHKHLLEKFRRVTDSPKATKINWAKLDRSLIPERYDEYKIDCVSMKIADFYKNPEIVNNIRFFK